MSSFYFEVILWDLVEAVAQFLEQIAVIVVEFCFDEIWFFNWVKKLEICVDKFLSYVNATVV